MKVRLISDSSGPRKGAVCGVLAIWVFCDRRPPWHFFIDDAGVCVSVAQADVEIVDPALDGFRFIEDNESKSGGQLLIDFLCENPRVLSGLLECDMTAYDALQELKRAE